jgi:hypothetical protein
MKFLVITQSDGKRRVSEHDCPSFDDLRAKLVASGSQDFRAYCEIGDLVESLSQRVSNLERYLENSNPSIPVSVDSNANDGSGKRQVISKPKSKLVRVELIEKHLILEDYELEIYESRINFELRFHNISKDKIRAVKGDLVFCDLFDAEIFRIGITMNDPIAPGKFSIWSGGFPYNQFDREHAHFAGFKKEDLHLYLDNEKVVM